MLAFFKKLFSSSASSTPATPPPTVAPPAPAAPPPPPAPTRGAPPPAPPLSPVPLATGDTVQLPLNDILSMLPSAVARLVVSRPGGAFQIPVNVVWEQIRSGAVRIPFAQLRQGAPPGTFADDASHDDSLIDLPLKQILAAIGPASLPRRTDQRRVDLPDDVAGVFGAKGLAPPLTGVSVAPHAPQPKAPAPVSMPKLKPAEVASIPPPAPKAVTPTVAPARPFYVPKAPAPPAFPKPVAPVAPLSAAVTLAPPISPLPSAPKPPSHAPLPYAGPTPTPLPFAARRVSPSPAAPPTAGPEPVGTTIGLLSSGWPASVLREIEELDLAGASVNIPVHRLEAAMKMGRVQFKWGELRGWLTVPPPRPSAQAETQVELPLNVIAPLFLARRRSVATQKKVAVGEDIPDLFAGLAKPAVPPAPAAPSLSPAPAAAPAVPQAPTPAPAYSVLGEIFGKPSKTEWTPQEIAQAISALHGVAGGLLASSDGLLVAGQAPAPIKSETLAAFVPQMFGRLAGYASEAQLGTLQWLTLNAGPAPCALFKTGRLFLAVLGKPGQALPETVLLRVAAELAKRNQ